MNGGISNWLIMKFGTPCTGAGPKSATDSEGLSFVGDPSGFRIGGSSTEPSLSIPTPPEPSSSSFLPLPLLPPPLGPSL